MSKQVADRERSSRAVLDAIQAHKSAIAAAQAELLREASSRLSVPVPDISALLALYAETLRHGASVLTSAHAAHAQEALDDAAPRERRDKAQRAVRSYLSSLRKIVDGFYGDEAMQTLGFWEPLPSSVELLRKYGETVLGALERPGLVLVPVLEGGGTQFDARVHAAALRPRVEELTAALAEVSREAAELATTLVARNEALRAHDSHFASIAGMVELMARSAGLGELAARIRPSERDPGVLADLPTEPTLEPTPAGPVVDAPAPRPRGMGPGFDPLDPEEPEEK